MTGVTGVPIFSSIGRQKPPENDAYIA